MNKRASLEDVGALVIVVFAVAVLFLGASKGYTEFVDRALNNTVINTSQSSVNAFTETKNLQARYDYVIFGLFIGFTLAIIIGSWFVPANPIFAFIYFLGLIIFIVLGLVFSYVWNILINKPIFSNVVNYFPITNFLLDHFGIYVTVVGFLAMIVMFAKPQQ